MFRPRLKAMTALWVITAMNTVIMWLVLFCSPMARPSKTEWKESARSSMTDLRLE